MTMVPCRLPYSFDHLVSTLLEEHGHIQAERPRGFEIDHKVELHRGLDGKITRLGTLEDAIDVRSRAAKVVAHVIPVRQQTTEAAEKAIRINSRQSVASGQRGDLDAVGGGEWTGHHDEATIEFACQRCNDAFQLGPVANRGLDRLHLERCSRSFEWLKKIFEWRGPGVEQEGSSV